MSASSPSPKRVKLDLSESLSPPDGDDEDDEYPKDDIEQDHCTICLQSFLDRTIIPVCAHEFCFECILLWAEQSRKCPLCSRSFDDSYLIHHIRSQHDYQKHYLLPRSSPPPLTDESRTTVLRNTRRERQWGRRQRQQREEADQLERAIAQRRWIYQHHLYAKHVASNPYTRYRPFPTPTQFAASSDLISRMTMFLRRELRVWPNLDVEFLTTYTVSLMKSIDIRSESAVKLLSEFLDLDTPYTAGARHINAEHFAHEIYSYLRSPYRDLNMYDQMAQYDTPPEISPPREIERGSRWSAEPSPSRRSRSRSHSRPLSPAFRRENGNHSPTPRRRDNSAEARPEDKPHHRHDPNRSLRGREDHNSLNPSTARRHNPPGGVVLRNGHLDGVIYPEASNSATQAEMQNDDFPVQSPPAGAENGNDQMTEDVEEIAAAIDSTQLSQPQGDDSAAVLAANEAGVTRLINGPSEGTGDKVADYVDDICGGSSANPQPSRKRSDGWNVHRNRTLSESVQAYLSRPTAPWCPPKTTNAVLGNQRSTGRDAGRADTRPRLLRLTDGRSGPYPGQLPSTRKATVERTSDGDAFSLNDVPPPEQPPHGHRFKSCLFSSKRAFSTGTEAADEEDGATRLNFADEITPGTGDGRSDVVFPPAVTSLARKSPAALSDNPSAVEGSSVDGCPVRVQTLSMADDSEGRTICERTLEARIPGGTAVPSSLSDGAAHGCTRTNMDTADARTSLGGGLRQAMPVGVVDLTAVVDDASGGVAAAMSMVEVVAESGAGSRSGSAGRVTGSGAGVGVEALALERRLRAKARVRVRLEALKSALDDAGSADVSGRGAGAGAGTGVG